MVFILIMIFKLSFNLPIKKELIVLNSSIFNEFFIYIIKRILF